ncbi:FAD-dependent oxidoreductase [Actinoplanes sp. TRM 88003]|uniref:FAD-dependent oxidoreductase n=2 Tax=Paractinoplanes aksuensis TaxID=2939490 RepID=A0ABT1DQX7_9ACTN|nr:FAD-dependent oxidoreductase [Actinoplanes aksuensis]
MGSAAAWSLARRGADVVLLERFAPGHTHGASHGASRIFRLAYAQPDYIALARRALDLWHKLESETGHPLLDLTGGVDHGLLAPIEDIAGALAASGVPGQWMALEEAAARWPGLRFTGPVFFHPSTGRVHADNAVAALQSAAITRGAVVRHETPVLSVTVRGDDDVEVVTAGETLRARRVVVAAGAWTPKLLPGLLQVRVTQEQPAHFAPLDPAAEWPSFIHHRPDLGVYGLATPGEGIKAGFHGTGPEVDPDHRDYAEEPRSAAQLRDYAREWLPGVDPDATTPISCTYTTTPTSDFVIDRTGPLVVLAGFSGHGFKFTPAIGELAADLVGGAPAVARFRLPYAR